MTGGSVPIPAWKKNKMINTQAMGVGVRGGKHKSKHQCNIFSIWLKGILGEKIGYNTLGENCQRNNKRKLPRTERR